MLCLAAVAGCAACPRVTLRRTQAFRCPRGDVRSIMYEEFFAAGKRDPVSIKDGLGEIEIGNQPGGSLFAEGLICHADFVVFFLAHVDAADAGLIPCGLRRLVHGQYRPVLVYQSDGRGYVIIKEVEVAEISSVTWCAAMRITPLIH